MIGKPVKMGEFLLMLSWTRDRLKYLGARLLQMIEAPQTEIDPVHQAAFEALWASASDATAPIVYDLPYPKHLFLRYLVQSKPLILHGSGNPDVHRLEPRPQTTFFGRRVEAVFATPDEIWCLFYAVVNGQGFHGSKRNICLRVAGPGARVRKFYWFSLSQPMLDRSEPYSPGMVYILPRRTFMEGEIADEWTSSEPVLPIARLPVEPADFPFLDRVMGHSDAETPWAFYWRMIWPRGRR